MNAKSTLLPILAVSALASCSGMKETRKVPVSYQAEPPKAANTNASQSAILYKAVNDYRKSLGVPELQRHSGLDRLAQEHCEYLRKNRGTFVVYGKNVSHMGDVGRCLIAIRVFHMMSTSENVAWMEPYGPETKVAQGFVTMWKNSPDHDYAMSSGNWTYTGVGTIVDTDGSVFATQLFSTTDFSPFTVRDRYNSF
ncbi:MAG: CAP domain-containing protein [Luteolibacter sp.]